MSACFLIVFLFFSRVCIQKAHKFANGFLKVALKSANLGSNIFLPDRNKGSPISDFPPNVATLTLCTMKCLKMSGLRLRTNESSPQNKTRGRGGFFNQKLTTADAAKQTNIS